MRLLRDISTRISTFDDAGQLAAAMIARRTHSVPGPGRTTSTRFA
jgi:hypothetical protein